MIQPRYDRVDDYRLIGSLFDFRLGFALVFCLVTWIPYYRHFVRATDIYEDDSRRRRSDSVRESVFVVYWDSLSCYVWCSHRSPLTLVVGVVAWFVVCIPFCLVFSFSSLVGWRNRSGDVDADLALP